eukprot:g1672.t1
MQQQRAEAALVVAPPPAVSPLGRKAAAPAEEAGGGVGTGVGEDAPAACESPSVRLRKLERDVVRTTRQMLTAAPGGRLKAVQVANALRARLGTALRDVLQLHGGLLSLLEHNDAVFVVHRVPKADFVALVDGTDIASIRRLNLDAETNLSVGSKGL